MSGLVADIAAVLTLEALTGSMTIVAHNAGSQLAMSFLISGSSLLARTSHVILIAGPLKLSCSDEVVAGQKRLTSMIAKEKEQGVIDSLLPLLTGKTTTESRPLAGGRVRAAAMSVPNESYAAAILTFANDTRAPVKAPEHIRILVVDGPNRDGGGDRCFFETLRSCEARVGF